MTTINLYQNQQEEKKKLPPINIGKGAIFSLAIFTFTLLVFACLKVTNAVMAYHNKTLNAKIESEKKILSEMGNIERILDLQYRVEKIKNNLQISKDNTILRLEMKDVLKNLEGELFKTGVVVSSYKYENGKVNVSFNTNDLLDTSRQILNFKKSSYFEKANFTGINKKENEITCDMEMYVNR